MQTRSEWMSDGKGKGLRACRRVCSEADSIHSPWSFAGEREGKISSRKKWLHDSGVTSGLGVCCSAVIAALRAEGQKTALLGHLSSSERGKSHHSHSDHLSQCATSSSFSSCQSVCLSLSSYLSVWLTVYTTMIFHFIRSKQQLSPRKKKLAFHHHRILRN